MKKTALLLLLVMSFLTFGNPIISMAQETMIVGVQADLAFRVGPGTEWRRIAVLPPGTNVALDGRSGNSLWVRGITQSGQVGWAFVEGFGLSPEAVGGLPVIDREAPLTVSAPPPGSAPVQQSAPAAAAPDVQPIVSSAPIRGFAYGGHIDSLSEATADALNRSGMTWVKKQARFRPGDDPNGWAGFVNDARARGYRVMLGVVGQPDQLLQDGYFDAYANFVGGLAALGVDAIEVWNEPNIDREWPAGYIDPGMYTQLLARAYNAIKATNPNTLVISGAPAPTGFFGGCSGAGCDDAPYMRGMAAAGAARYMDCVGVHYNEGIVPPTQNSGDPRSEYFTRYYSGMVNTYYSAFNGQRPLCFTELGYLSPEGFPPLPGGFAWAQNVTVAQQAAWLSQVVNIARNSGRVRLLIVWNVDFRNYGSDPMAGYAMIRPDGSCPACDALGR